jgi:hypothetical protein
MRRAEMARRRRNLSEKRNEEVKVCSLFISGSIPHFIFFICKNDFSLLPPLFLLPLFSSFLSLLRLMLLLMDANILPQPQMETINKLLKKQAPKTTKRAALLAGDETPEVEGQRPDPMFIRWVNTKEGSRLAMPEELLTGPAGRLFVGGAGGSGGGRGLAGGKMVEEVS